MKLKNLIIIILAMICQVAAAKGIKPAQPDGILRILAIGNSFSHDAIEQNLYELFADQGQEVIIGNLYIGGCSLERHYKNSVSGEGQYKYRKIVNGVKTEYPGTSLYDGITDEKWDVITLQQASGRSGIYDTYTPYLPALVDYVCTTASNKDFILGWHMTWSYSKDSNHKEFPKYDNDQEKMYQMIVSATQAALADNPRFGLVIPCGTAIQNGRKSYLGDTFNRDGYHLDLTYGRFIAACTWYEAISGHDVRKNGFVPSNVDAKAAAAVKKAAHQAIKSPFKER